MAQQDVCTCSTHTHQIFAIDVLEHIIKTNGLIFKWGRTQLEMRWLRLLAVFAKTSSFKIRNPLQTRSDAYTNTPQYPQTPPYLWYFFGFF